MIGIKKENRMSHLTKAIIWLLLVLLTVFCCIVGVITQNWVMLVGCIIICVSDIIEASIEFSAWARERGKKDGRRQ